jgi:DNA-directed RNA polymerase specialized sigma24 family protein
MENTAKDYMSKEKKLYNREAPLDFASKVASSMDAFERIELDSVIDSLGFPDSTIIKMMMDGYDYTDMGKVLNMSQTAIATRVHRNKSKWQDYLSKSLNG